MEPSFSHLKAKKFLFCFERRKEASLLTAFGFDVKKTLVSSEE